MQSTRRHRREGRLIWDIFKLAHHCSYLTLGPERGENETEPVEDVAWLFEEQMQRGGIIVSTSKPIPEKGSDEDESTQPPHRQAASYYTRNVNKKDGQFIVTMKHPSEAAPRAAGHRHRPVESDGASHAAGRSRRRDRRPGAACRATPMNSDFLDPGGETVPTHGLALPRAQALAQLAGSGALNYVRLIGCRRLPGAGGMAEEAILLDLDIERGQLVAHDIRYIERVAAVFRSDDAAAPEVLALRSDFPCVPHLNLRTQELPRCLCLYDRTWPELALRWTPAAFVERIRQWLALTAQGGAAPG